MNPTDMVRSLSIGRYEMSIHVPNVDRIVFGEFWLPLDCPMAETLSVEWTQDWTVRPPSHLLLKDLVKPSSACLKYLVLLDAVSRADESAPTGDKLQLPALTNLKLSGPPNHVRGLLDAIAYPASTVVHFVANKHVGAMFDLGAMALSASECT